MSQTSSMTQEIIARQLESLRDDFRRLPEDKLFRMYLHYMIEYCPEKFNQVVESEMTVVDSH
jgi:hypothetical protein